MRDTLPGLHSFLLMPLFSFILVPPLAIISVYIERQRRRPSEHTLEVDWIATFSPLRRAFKNPGPECSFFYPGVEDTDSFTRVMAGWILPRAMFIHRHLSTRSAQLSLNLDTVAVLGKGEIWALILAFQGWVMSSSGLSAVSFVKEGRLEQILGATGLCRGALGLLFSLQPGWACYHPESWTSIGILLISLRSFNKSLKTAGLDKG